MAPQTLASTLQLLTPQEQMAQRERWQGPQRDWPFIPLHQRFQAHAQHQPQAPALRYDTHLLTYQQLDHLSNQLAHLLISRGLLPSGRVALYQPRDHWAIICLLAVLKAGGCYAPIAEDLPAARVRLLLEDLKPTILISQQSLLEPLDHLPAQVLRLEEMSTLLAPLPITPPQIEVEQEQLAYIMYTSGSTGVSKGVEIRQGSVSNYIQALCELLEVEAGWHFATVSNLAADLGNTAIFTALASGGCLHVLPYLLVTDGAAFASYVERYPLDVLKIVPSHLQALLAAGATRILPQRHLILGGETLPWTLVEHLQQLQITCNLYNHYGPTEATIGPW
ncbi:AMP-binding protein [Ktedonobacter sp. SOSP1-52]|uniref:AMP-binding protein n=1 Tax=Ktedonobacter sp. SOSP1-52 TaxID=2778366 RepID=UPI0035B4E745